MAAATARGELVALVDALDMFDVESAAAAGVDLDRAALDPRPRRHQSGAVPRAQSARHRAGDSRVHAGAAGRQLRPRRLRRRRGAGRRGAPAAVHHLAAAAADGGRESDGVPADWAASRWRGVRRGSRWTRAGLRDSGSGMSDSANVSCSTGIDVEARIVRARAREQEEASVALSTSASDALISQSLIPQSPIPNP